MRGLNRSCFALCVAAFVLSGCGGGQGPAPVMAPGGGVIPTVPASGGVFGASYSGTANVAFGCVPSRDHGFRSRFISKGAGVASFLGVSTESGDLHQFVDLGFCARWHGAVRLVSSTNDQNYIVMYVRGPRSMSPCGRTLRYKVKSGGGAFASATGSGTVRLLCTVSSSSYIPYSDRWTGSLNF